MSGAIVVFSGMDGAGKSTQIAALDRQLRQAGLRPLTLWSRGGYTPGMNWLKSLLRRVARGGMPATGPSRERSQAFARPAIRRTWLWLAIADLGLLYGLWLRWKKAVGHVVICDRYLPDTQVDFALNFPEENVHRWWIWRILCRVAPQPDVAFLMTIPVAGDSHHRARNR